MSTAELSNFFDCFLTLWCEAGICPLRRDRPWCRDIDCVVDDLDECLALSLHIVGCCEVLGVGGGIGGGGIIRVGGGVGELSLDEFYQLLVVCGLPVSPLWWFLWRGTDVGVCHYWVVIRPMIGTDLAFNPPLC